MDDPLKNSTIKALEKGIKILSMFDLQKQEVRVSEVSAALECNKSTASRLLSTLAKGGLVRKDRETQRYSLGFKILELSRILATGIDVVNQSQFHMRKLRDATGEMASLHLVVDDQRVCVAEVRGYNPVNFTQVLGRRMPLHCGGPGKALLAFMPPERLEAILARGPLQAIAPNTITDPRILRVELRKIGELGYSTSVEEGVKGVISVAAPVRDFSGEVIACLALASTTSTSSIDALLAHVPILLQTAMDLSRDLGFQAPTS
ncbi:MAG: IclR family transcriptional regulator [Chloroflexi bacterium]|nr:IclR family transcriptional regulator [Chloroflexota bacterium]